MKLFYLPGSCALASHVALECSGLAYEAVRVERGAQTDPTYLAINPLGRVPALVTATHGTITEVPAVLSYIADVATGLAHVHFENSRTTCLFWSVQRHLSVETPRARQGRVQDLGAVCGSQQHNTDARVKAVELGQQLVQRLFLLVVAAETTR